MYLFKNYKYVQPFKVNCILQVDTGNIAVFLVVVEHTNVAFVYLNFYIYEEDVYFVGVVYEPFHQ